MKSRERPEVLSTRVNVQEKALIRALAEAQSLTVSEAIHRVLVPGARARLAEIASARPELDEAA